MTPMRVLRPHPRLLLVPMLALAGAAVGWLGDSSLVATLFLLAEPFLWVLALWGGWAAYTKGAPGLAVALLCGCASAALGARIPQSPAEPVGMDEAPFASRLRKCARALELPSAPVRVLSWTPGAVGAEVLTAIADAAPDVVILRAHLSGGEVDALRAAVGGASVQLGGDREPTWVFANGVFDTCGPSDHWLDRPAPGAELGAVFVHLRGGTRLPILTARLPPPRLVARWARHLADTRAALHATANTLESSLVVVAVDAPFALGSPRLTRSLLDAALLPMVRGPNWPGGPLPLHSFDQVWAAEAWRSGEQRQLAAAGTARNGQLVQLQPRWPVTLPAS